MKFPGLLSFIGLALVLSHCAPESPHSPVKEVPPQPVIPVGPETSFVKDLRGSRIEYRDNRGDNCYLLQKIGTYDFSSISRNRKVNDTRRGIWMYKQTGEKRGQLILDGNDIWELTFVSPHRAIAKAAGDKRSYTFEFEWL